MNLPPEVQYALGRPGNAASHGPGYVVELCYRPCLVRLGGEGGLERSSDNRAVVDANI